METENELLELITSVTSSANSRMSNAKGKRAASSAALAYLEPQGPSPENAPEGGFSNETRPALGQDLLDAYSEKLGPQEFLDSVSKPSNWRKTGKRAYDGDLFFLRGLPSALDGIDLESGDVECWTFHLACAPTLTCNVFVPVPEAQEAISTQVSCVPKEGFILGVQFSEREIY